MINYCCRKMKLICRNKMTCSIQCDSYCYGVTINVKISSPVKFMTPILSVCSAELRWNGLTFFESIFHQSFILSIPSQLILKLVRWLAELNQLTGFHMSSKHVENINLKRSIGSKQIKHEIYSKELWYNWHNLPFKASAHKKLYQKISYLAPRNRTQN